MSMADIGRERVPGRKWIVVEDGLLDLVFGRFAAEADFTFATPTRKWHGTTLTKIPYGKKFYMENGSLWRERGLIYSHRPSY
jgi:hypothetical protein